MAVAGDTGEAVRRIVARADLDDLTERVLDSFWDRPEYLAFRPPRAEARDWVRWNIDLVLRWLVDGGPPGEADVERFRQRAKKLAREGMPADVVPANFRTGARAAWSALLEAAHPDERQALLEGADLLFDYIDRVSQVFSATYGAAEPASASGEALRAQALLQRMCTTEALIPEDLQAAERIGFELEGEHRPFALTAAGLPATHHAALAGGLRAEGVLAASEGPRVVGLAHERAPGHEIFVGSETVVAVGEPTSRADLAPVLDELRGAVDVAARRGRVGTVEVEDHVGELLLRSSPRLAARIEARVYGRLEAREPELARTLDVLIERDFDRGAAAAALPVHRNTLNNRLHRIRAITGIDVGRTEGRALAWLAWLHRQDRWH